MNQKLVSPKKKLFLQKNNKNTKHMKIKLLFLFAFISSLSFSQIRTCGMEEKMAELMFNPVMKQKYEEQLLKFEQELDRLENSRFSNFNI